MTAKLDAQQDRLENGKKIDHLGNHHYASTLKLKTEHLSLLIIDDHPINRMLLKQQLELLGIQAEAAESGTQALSMWQNRPFDLIVTDCHMPEMDGYELTYRIREFEQQSGAETHPHHCMDRERDVGCHGTLHSYRDG